MTDVNVNDTVYNEASFENGGHRVNFFKFIADLLIEAFKLIGLFATTHNATSTTSLTIGAGTHSATIEVDKAYAAGVRLRFASTANVTTHWMEGVVTAYDKDTGVIDFTIDTVLGSGTIASWNIVVAGAKGATANLVEEDPNPQITANMNTHNYDVRAGVSDIVNLKEESSSYYVEFPSERDYTFSNYVAACDAGAIIETSVILAVGTATITPKINDSAMTGGTNSASTTINKVTRNVGVAESNKLSFTLSSMSADASGLTVIFTKRRGL